MQQHYGIVSDIFLFCFLDGQDFTTVSQSLTFSPQALTQCIQVVILQDNISENPEIFNVLISSDDPDVKLSSPSTSVTITDDDSVTIGLEMETYLVREDQGSVELCAVVSNGELDREAVVTLATSDQSAEGNLLFVCLFVFSSIYM